MKLLKDYFALQKQIYDFFGYEEDWRVIPLEDSTEYYWHFDEQDEEIRFAETREDLIDDGTVYVDTVYHQRFLPRYVYRAVGYTLIVVDTHTDGNKFLKVFDNQKEVI